MSRITRFVVLVTALMPLLAMMSSTAGAITWHNSGDMALTATANAFTLSATGTGGGWVCPAGGTMTGDATTNIAGAAGGLVHGTVKWHNCQLGTTGWTVDCSYTLTATNWQAGPPAVTSGTLDLTCGYWLANLNVCHIEGNVEGHYTNPVAGGATTGVLTITTGGNLTVTNGASQCPLGTNDKGHISEFTLQVTSGTASSMGPIITRTS